MLIDTAAAVPWGMRAAALLEIIEELGARAADAQSPRRRTALLGMRCLAAFAKKQFELFSGGFDEGGPLVPDPGFPEPFLLEAMIRQVSFDVDVVLRAVAQRDDANSTASMRAILDLADHLAAHALAPAVRNHLAEETAVLTYFQKSPTIRLMPYVPLALIGIDFVAIHDTGRLIAIAHEAGHHVYRQMTVNYAVDVAAQAPRRAPAAEPNWPEWLAAWEEEIFADVYAALVAGPVAGLSVQAMLMDGLPAALTSDDGDHPLGALRPAAYTAALRKLAATRPNHAFRKRILHAATALDANWDEYLAKVGCPDEFVPAGSAKAVTLKDGRELVVRFVAHLLAHTLSAVLKDHATAAWSDGLEHAETAGLSDLYGQFAGELLGFESDALPELTLGKRGHKVQVVPQAPGVHGGEREIGQIGDPYLDKLRDQGLANAHRLAPGEWKAVFLAGDWVTEAGGSGITPVKR